MIKARLPLIMIRIAMIDYDEELYLGSYGKEKE